MKKILFAAALFASASTVFVACSGSDTTAPVEVKAITLVADKEAIEADGKDAVHFTVTTDTGENITENAILMIPETDTFLDADVKEYTSSVDEEVTFQARYNGIYSNEVTVTVQNRSKYEKYFRRVLVAQLTGTWCVACPNLTRSLKILTGQMPDKIEVIAMHGSSAEEPDPYDIPQTTEMFSVFSGLRGFPSAVIDMRQKTIDVTSSMVLREINRSLSDYPATCGVKISSTYNKESKVVDATVTVAAEKTNKYAFGLAVVVDGLVYTQTGAENDPDYRHNNVVLTMNAIKGGLIDDGEIKANEEKSHTFQIDLSQTKHNIDNMRVVAYILAKDGDNFYVNNVASCKLDGGSVDYKYN